MLGCIIPSNEIQWDFETDEFRDGAHGVGFLGQRHPVSYHELEVLPFHGHTLKAEDYQREEVHAHHEDDTLDERHGPDANFFFCKIFHCFLLIDLVYNFRDELYTFHVQKRPVLFFFPAACDA